MLHIIIHETMGFGGGGWDTGYYIYIVKKTGVPKPYRSGSRDIPNILKWFLRYTGIKYRIHIIKYAPDGNEKFKKLIAKLRKGAKS